MKSNGIDGWKTSLKNEGKGERSHFWSIIETFIQNSSDAVCLFDSKGQVMSFSPSCLLLFTTKSSKACSQLFSHLDLERAQDGQPQKIQDRLIQPNGDSFDAEIVHLPVVIEGEMLGSFCFVKKHQEDQRLEQNLLTYLETIFNRLDIAVWSANLEENRLMCVSSAIQDIYDMPLDEVRFDTWKSLVHPDDLEEVKKAKSQLLTDGKIVHTYRIITPKNRTKWIHDHTIAIKDPQKDVTQILGCLEDVTESKALQQKLQEMVYIDGLTQLPNRYYGREILKKLISKSDQNTTAFALFYINLNGFNRINETFGHRIGDDVMKQAAQRMHHFIKGLGTVCRVSGNEMLAIIDVFRETDELYKLAHALIEVIEAPLPINGYTIYVSATIGISLFPNDGQDITSLVKTSRAALARAKQLGNGNIQVYSSSMNIESFKMLQLDGDLRKAIENGELFLEYQPKICFQTQKAVGAEALLRWQHPIWGIVSPAEFIPVAEAGSVIQQIGDFVIKTVCRVAGEWRQQGVPFQQLAFNLSPKNLYKNDLVERLEANLSKYGADASKLEIEITEGALLRQTDDVKKQISKLKELGIRISLDDYGTGYSSIHYLKQYPIDTLKIDQSFIQKVAQDSVDRVIVKSIVDLAKGLNKRVIAEGVETLDQFNVLKKMGCDEAQGYLFSKALPASEMKELFLLEKVKPKLEVNPSLVNRRLHERVRFPFPLRTNMTILSIHQKEVHVGSTEVLVQGISFGGIWFLSHLRLEPGSDILYGFQTVIMNTPVSLKGKMIWHEEVSNEIFEYGVELLIEETERGHLTGLLHQLSKKIQTNPHFNEGNFIIGQDPVAYLRGKR